MNNGILHIWQMHFCYGLINHQWSAAATITVAASKVPQFRANLNLVENLKFFNINASLKII